MFVGTELVAAGAALAVQQQRGASLNDQIALAVSVAGLLGVLWAVARFVLKPLLHAWVFTVLAHESERTAGVVVKALDHDDDTRAVTRRFQERLFHDRLVSGQALLDLVETNKDRIEFLEASMKAQGEALTKDMASAMREFTKSNEQQTQIMREMQSELKKLSEAYIRLDTTVQNWNGEERRHPR